MGSTFDTSENNFDFLRFAFASLVIFSHTWPLNAGSATPDPLGELVTGRSLGEVAVNGFFVISGFLIAGSWERTRGLLAFLKKRVFRIYPAFIVLMAIQAFLLAPYLTDGPIRPYTMRQLALIAGETVDLVSYGYPYGGLYVPLSHAPVPELNGAIWTIRYEFICYLLLVFLGVSGLFKRKQFVVGLFCAALFVYVARLHLPSSKVITVLFGAIGPWPRFLAHFLAGASFYLLRSRIPHSAKLAALAGVGLLAGIAIPPLFDFVMPTCGTYVLFWFAVRRGPLNHFGRFGDVSYGMYLYGFPIQQMIVRAYGASLPLAVQFLGAWCVAIACGFVSWNLVERWFLHRSTIARIEPRAAS